MNRRAWPADPSTGLPEVITIAAALEAGMSRDQVRQHVRAGRWRAVDRGVFVPAATLDRITNPHDRERRMHLARASAALQRYPDAGLGVESAALAQGLSLWGPVPHHVALIVPVDRPVGPRAPVRFTCADVPETHWSTSVRATNPARTCIDLARRRPLAQALAALDAAIRTGQASPAELARMLRECAGLRGEWKARTALVHASAMRESPLESASWAYFVLYHVPLPEMQVTIVDMRGRPIARVDYWWKKARLVGECDGQVKYGDRRTHYEEKRREDELRAEGNDVIRWGAGNLHGPQLADDICRRLDRA